MPAAQVMVERLNTYFNRSNIGNLRPEQFDEGTNLVALAKEIGVVSNGVEEDVLSSIPDGTMEAVRALIRHNLQRATPLAIQFVWAPGYDYEITVWEAAGTSVSPGGISVQIRTRYPLDEHPSTIGQGSSS
jgi:hypothetical protein